MFNVINKHTKDVILRNIPTRKKAWQLACNLCVQDETWDFIVVLAEFSNV